MGKIFDQMTLRNHGPFRGFIHAAILEVADSIMSEPPETPYHAARAAMANKIITTNEEVVIRFVDRILFRGVMDDEIRESVIHNGNVILEVANETAILNGIDALWNETTLAVWPTILDDIA